MNELFDKSNTDTDNIINKPGSAVLFAFWNAQASESLAMLDILQLLWD